LKAATDLRYPIGEFSISALQAGPPASPQRRDVLIAQIAGTPAALEHAVAGLSASQLDTPYRPGGWTVRQVVHHVPESHMNSYIRFKLALTEQEPVVKPYDEQSWARLPDARETPVEVSLALLRSLHARWTILLHAMQPADWLRTFQHPELGLVRLDVNLALYAWHGPHHVAHITSLRQRMKW
jgi:hypothetical protein